MHPDSTVAETLPRVYRRVLDAVGRLEALGARDEAASVRRTAIAVYSSAWNAKSHRRLEEIAARAEAAASSRERRTTLRVA